MTTVRAIQGWSALLCVLLCWGNTALGQHPIEVERLSAAGDHLRAMVAFEKLPDRRLTTAAIVAFAKSAWALSLNDRAALAFDRALRDRALPSDEKARVFFSRALIEYQNGAYQVSGLFAERAVSVLSEPSPLRAQILNLWGQSLAKLGDTGLACGKFLQASAEAEEEQRPEIFFALGNCQRKLGSLEESRQSFEHIPLQHERAPQAVRALAQVALELKRFVQADFWLAKGRELFPQSFLDSWVDYARVQIATELEKDQEVETLLQEMQERFPPSDAWFQLTRACAEAYLWKRAHGASPATPASKEGGV